MNNSLQQLCDAVQKNCHISDARHGTDYGLCTYLMKMREYFRWEQGLGFEATLKRCGGRLADRTRGAVEFAHGGGFRAAAARRR